MGRTIAGARRPALVAAVVAVAMLARLALIAREVGPGGLTLDDPDQYLPLARALADGRGFSHEGRPTAYRPPLYPLLLSPLAWAIGEDVAWGVAGLHVALGGLATAATYLAARRWGLSNPRSLVAATVVALDPVLASQARMVMTETLAAALSAVTLLALTAPGRLGPVLGGAGFGLSALCRPTAWPVLLLTAAASAALPPGRHRDRLRRTALLVAGAVAVAAPWAARNAAVFGEPIWTTTHGGYTLYLANNHVYYDEVVDGPPGAVWTGANQYRWWDAANRAARGLSEPDADRLFRREALRVIASRPGDFARATAARLGRFWGVAPSSAVYGGGPRRLTAAWTVPLWIALVAGLASPASRGWPRAAAAATLLGLTCVHAFYWTDMRMRSAAVPAAALIASAAGVREAPRRHPADAEKK